MSRLFNIIRFVFRALRTAPGDAIVIQVAGVAGETREIEFYQLPGVASGPTPGDRAASIDMGGYRVAVASHNYRISVGPQEGETIIYSTDADGGTVKAKIELDTDGRIKLNGDDKRLVTFAELEAAKDLFMNALNAHVHGGVSSGSSSTSPPAAMTFDISAAETQTIRTGG